MKAAAAIGAALLLAGCGEADAGLRRCEDGIKARIASPATYRRAEVSRFPGGEAEPRPGFMIGFDAENAQGASIRHTAFCDLAADEASPPRIEITRRPAY